MRKICIIFSLFSALILSGCNLGNDEEKNNSNINNLNLTNYVSVFNAQDANGFSYYLHGIKQDGTTEIVKKNNGENLRLSSYSTSLININSKYFIVYDTSSFIVNKLNGQIYNFPDDIVPLGNGSFYTQKSYIIPNKINQDEAYLICTNKINTEWTLMKMSLGDDLKLTPISLPGDNLYNYRNFVVDKNGTAIYNAHDKENNFVTRCVDVDKNVYTLSNNNIKDYCVAGNDIIFSDSFNSKTRFQKLSISNGKMETTLIGYGTSYMTFSQDKIFSPYNSDDVIYNNGNGYFDFYSTDNNGYLEFYSASKLGLFSIKHVCVSKNNIYFYGDLSTESSDKIIYFVNNERFDIKTGIYSFTSLVSSNSGVLTFVANLSGGGSVVGVYNGSFNVKETNRVNGNLIGL